MNFEFEIFNTQTLVIKLLERAMYLLSVLMLIILQ